MSELSILTESDVEQKFLWPLFIRSTPEGFSFATSDIATKPSIRRFKIDKGTHAKLYYPDYVVVIGGLPVLVAEAKHPDHDLDEAFREARLYAAELNALFPPHVNPCMHILATNSREVWHGRSDHNEPVRVLASAQLSAAHQEFSDLLDQCNRAALQRYADGLRPIVDVKEFRRPVSLVGGDAFQNDELPQNSFGATIVGDYGHIFNPRSITDRELIAREAYIASQRRMRYIEPIDRMIRNAIAPSARKIEAIRNTSEPRELIAQLQSRQKLENQLLLLVGSVGAGKSTFVDYLSKVALPEDLKETTVWLRLDLNDAPLEVERAYDWVDERIVQGFRGAFLDVDFDALEVLEKVYSRELSALRKGALSVLDEDSVEFKTRLADNLLELQGDRRKVARALAHYLCTAGNRLLVIALDNCDKRNSEEQLKMFQVAQWIQSEFRCLVVLPLRDVTFDLYRTSPPLDTALKQFIFRIEPPAFSDVLQARVRLALTEMGRDASTANSLSFQLPNGMKVSYAARDQSLYLASMLRSLYAHDRLVRQIMTGLAGRDVRRALEIFLEFCMSGHIGEDEIFRIRQKKGNHELSLEVVTRVLLRMKRKYYNGDKSYLKNLLQCSPKDAWPDHFTRISILTWFDRRKKKSGPADIEGFHRAGEALCQLNLRGHDAIRVREEMLYLVREGCLVAEHLRTDALVDDDLLKITASGVVHLQILTTPEYLAACAEDTYIAEPQLQELIAGLISRPDHLDQTTAASISIAFVLYLRQMKSSRLRSKENYVEPEDKDFIFDELSEVESAFANAEELIPERVYLGNLPYRLSEGELTSLLTRCGVKTHSVAIPVDRDSGRGRGFAFVELAGVEELPKLLGCRQKLVINGRDVRIGLHDRKGYQRNRNSESNSGVYELTQRVFMHNLPYTTDEIQLQALLAEHDLTAKSLFIIRDKTTGNSRGCAIVELDSLDAASQTIGAIDEFEFGGRVLSVRPAKPRT